MSGSAEVHEDPIRSSLHIRTPYFTAHSLQPIHVTSAHLELTTRTTHLMSRLSTLSRRSHYPPTVHITSSQVTSSCRTHARSIAIAPRRSPTAARIHAFTALSLSHLSFHTSLQIRTPHLIAHSLQPIHLTSINPSRTHRHTVTLTITPIPTITLTLKYQQNSTNNHNHIHTYTVTITFIHTQFISHSHNSPCTHASLNSRTTHSQHRHFHLAFTHFTSPQIHLTASQSQSHSYIHSSSHTHTTHLALTHQSTVALHAFTALTLSPYIYT